MIVRPWIATLWAAFAATAGAAQASTPGSLAGQFRAEISQLSWTPVATNPQIDEVDLAAMARSALNYLRGNPDPKRGYECKFSLGPLGIPCHVPMIAPNRWGFDPVSLGDTDCRMDMQYAHMRTMAGQAEPDPAERGVKARVRSYQHDDGLCWINPAAYIGRPIDGEWAGTWTTAKLLYSLAEEFHRTGDNALRQHARKTFRALKGMALWDGPRAYYPGIAPYKDGKWLRDGWCEQHARNYPFVVEPCVRYWEATGDKEALEFAKAITEGFLAGSQKDQGAQAIDSRTGAFQGHVHLHTHAVWGVAHLGAVIHEPRYLDWAAKAYDFVVRQGTDFGWYPEFVPQGEYRTEICVVGDMVSLGAWLARGGRPHYWDHVERTVRNELRRSQFALTPAFLQLFRKLHQDQPPETINQALAELRKLEGGFVAQATFDDWVSYPGKPKLGAAGLYNNGIHMMGCCPPEGMRGLWEAFCGAVEEFDGTVRINMAFSRDHPAARVTAYRPQDGRIDVSAKKAGTYQLRAPAWTDRATVRLLRNGQPSPVAWVGPVRAYVACANVRPGERLTLTWSVPHFVQTFVAQSIPSRKQKVVVRWTGNEAVGVEPRGRYLPMFSAAPSEAGNWPQWRGPAFNGSTDERPLPSKWSKTENIAWTANLPGAAASTPIVWDSRVFLSAVDQARDKLQAMCFDRVTGRLLWCRDVAQGTRRDHRSNYASNSPVTDGVRVVFFYGTGDLVCYDFEGKSIWARNLERELGPFAYRWTLGGSPLLYGGTLYVQILQRDVPVDGRGHADRENRSFLLALDPASGKTRWQHFRPSRAAGESHESHTTPIPMLCKGRTQLLIAGGDALTGHDPATGRELWRWDAWNPRLVQNWPLIASPVAADGVALVCVPKNQPVYAVRADRSGTLDSSAVAWDSHADRPVTSEVPTPALYDGDLFVVSDSRKSLTRLDPRTGKIKWTMRTPGLAKYEASPLAGDGKIYLIIFAGLAVVVDAADGRVIHQVEMDQPAENEMVRASIIAAQGQLFIRTTRHLYCVGPTK